MTHFVPTDLGWVNLAHVQSIRLKPGDARSREAVDLIDASGSYLGSMFRDFLEPDDLCRIIAAAPGTTAVVIHPYLDAHEKWAAEAKPRTVIAWLLTHSGPKPLFLKPPGGDDVVLHPMPDGTFQDEHGESYETLGEAVEAVADVHHQMAAQGA